MQRAHFSRIFPDTTWSTLNKIVKQQRLNTCKPLPYLVLSEITISSKTFEELSQSLITPHKCYSNLTKLSVSNSYGIWNCILISCANDTKNILIYTAGNIYPLYGSILSL